MNIIFQNSSIIALQLSVFFSGIFWTFRNAKSIYIKRITLFLLIINAVEIIILESRAALIASMAGAFYVSYPVLRKKDNRKRIFASSFLLFLTSTFFLLLFIKTNSTLGRWFIWKNSFQLFKENWATGVGIGKFNPAYNHLQAEYFSNHLLTSKEAVLADDGYFAFNEWLHFASEWGIVGLLISVSASYVILKQCFKKVDTNKGWAGAMLIPVFVGCMFSYPLHNIFIVGLTAFLVGYITTDFLFLPIRFPGWLTRVFFTVLICLLTFFSYRYYYYNQAFSKAKQSAKEGYKNEAIDRSKKIANELKKSYSFSIFYLELLYETARADEAIKWFNDFHPYHCNQIAHAVIAKCYDELRDFDNAERHYLTSLYITPHLLQSRIDLLNFYDRLGDIDNAKRWAQQTVECPIKIKNPRADYLKQIADRYLKSH